MKLSAVISVSILAATALAQNVGLPVNLPACPKACVSTVLSNAGQIGCEANDFKCLCGSIKYHEGVEKCAVAQCASTEIDLLRDVNVKYCEQAGVAVTLPHAVSEGPSPDHPFPTFTTTGGLPDPSSTVTQPNYPYPLPTDQSPGSFGTDVFSPENQSSFAEDDIMTAFNTAQKNSPVTSSTAFMMPTSRVELPDDILPPLNGHIVAFPFLDDDEVPYLPVVITPDKVEASVAPETAQPDATVTVPVEETPRNATVSMRFPSGPSFTIPNKPQTSAPKEYVSGTDILVNVNVYALIAALFAALV